MRFSDSRKVESGLALSEAQNNGNRTGLSPGNSISAWPGAAGLLLFVVGLRIS